MQGAVRMDGSFAFRAKKYIHIKSFSPEPFHPEIARNDFW
jgi:hypothetical protein